MGKLKVLLGTVSGAAMALVVVGSVFAADPFASSIASGTSTTVADYTAAVGDVFPILLGLAVITLIAKRTLRFFGR